MASVGLDRSTAYTPYSSPEAAASEQDDAAALPEDGVSPGPQEDEPMSLETAINLVAGQLQHQAATDLRDRLNEATKGKNPFVDLLPT